MNPPTEAVERVARAMVDCDDAGDLFGRGENMEGWQMLATAALHAMQPAIDAAVLVERERCAKVADEYSSFATVAAAIRDAIRKVPT